jgi:transposase InsO family protein
MTVDRMCALGKVSRATFYRFDSSRQRLDRDVDLRDEIQRIALEYPSYGRPRITAELNSRGSKVGHRRVRRILKEDNLLCLRRRKFRVITTDSDHGLRVYPNLAADINVTQIDQLWIADITYIRLETEFIYLAVVLDAFSRRVIGWALDRHLEDDLSIAALAMALRARQPREGLTHHSDRGVQYASHDYTSLLNEYGVRISMSRKGNPYDKAYASYCTSCEPQTMFSEKSRRLASLTPCAFLGGLGPGSSYSQSSRSFTG